MTDKASPLVRLGEKKTGLGGGHVLQLLLLRRLDLMSEQGNLGTCLPNGSMFLRLS